MTTETVYAYFSWYLKYYGVLATKFEGYRKKTVIVDFHLLLVIYSTVTYCIEAIEC